MQHMVELEAGVWSYRDSKIDIRAGHWVVGKLEGQEISGLSLAHVYKGDKKVLALYAAEDGARPLEIFIESPTKYPALQNAAQNFIQLYKHGYKYHAHDRFRKSALRTGIHLLQDMKHTVAELLKRSNYNRPKFELTRPAPELEI